MFGIGLIIYIKIDSALNNLQRLLSHRIQTDKKKFEWERESRRRKNEYSGGKNAKKKMSKNELIVPADHRIKLKEC